MKIDLLGSSFGDGAPQQYAMSYVIDDALAIDAGCLGFATPLDVQRRVRHVFLSHSHNDHIGSLPQFIENVYRPGAEPPTVHGNDDVLDCLRRHVFNDRVWPDMVRLSEEERTTFLRLERLESGRPVRVGHLTITPVDLDHIVPTLGFIVADAASAVAFVSDTGPTEEIWRVANRTANLKAIFLEASFPNSMGWLAEKSAHLTPALFLGEYRKLERPVPVIAVHVKAAFRDEMLLELTSLGVPDLQIGSPRVPYVF